MAWQVLICTLAFYSRQSKRRTKPSTLRRGSAYELCSPMEQNQFIYANFNVDFYICLDVTVWMLLFGYRSSSNRPLPVPSLLHVLYPREGSVPWGQSSARAVGRAGDVGMKLHELQDVTQSSGSDVITDSGGNKMAHCPPQFYGRPKKRDDSSPAVS